MSAKSDITNVDQNQQSQLQQQEDVAESDLLAVDVNRLFDIEPIAAEAFSLLPKDFDSDSLKKCVYRKNHADAIVGELREKISRLTDPGLYIRGPAGAGKSVLVYTIVQIAKFRLNWFTVYIPNCKAWSQGDGITQAPLGYFLDRVKEAFSADGSDLKNKFSDIWGMVNDAHVGKWEDYGNKSSRDAIDKVHDKYYEVVAALKTGRKDTPILLVFDEVNALFDDRLGSGILNKAPFHITDFNTPSLTHGALLVSGTTDSEFVAEIPNGYNKSCIYNINKGFEPEETDSFLETDLGKPLKRVRDFDQDLWNHIDDACCNIPRHLKEFSHKLRNVSSQIDDADAEHAKKKLKADIEQVINTERRDSRRDHQKMLQKILTDDQTRGITLFEESLYKWCEKNFLNNNCEGDLQILRVPNFFYEGGEARPTTVDAVTTYFRWFVEKCRDKTPRCIADNLQTLGGGSDANGSERGRAFERFLAAKLTLCGADVSFRFRYHVLGEAHITAIEMPISNRIFTFANFPPRDFRNYPTNTLLTHSIDRDGGEARVDMIYYGRNRVIYMEATIDNYRNTKLPSGDSAEDRKDSILASIKKWLGESVYNVSIDAASKELSVSYCKNRTTCANANRPQLPDVYYVVVTTCPASVQPSKTRCEEHKWIKVCFLEDLVNSQIVPSVNAASILCAQAEDAGGSEQDAGALNFLNRMIRMIPIPHLGFPC